MDIPDNDTNVKKKKMSENEFILQKKKYFTHSLTLLLKWQERGRYLINEH